jgi:hypothetical protein
LLSQYQQLQQGPFSVRQDAKLTVMILLLRVAVMAQLPQQQQQAQHVVHVQQTTSALQPTQPTQQLTLHLPPPQGEAGQAGQAHLDPGILGSHTLLNAQINFLLD